jgi:serine/threonine-protein kinase
MFDRPHDCGTDENRGMTTLEYLGAALAKRYALERELGHGGAATVYLARDLRYDRLVAIKILRRELVSTVSAGRFLREISVVAQLRHPNILPVLDSGETDGIPFYVMPYVEGGSLNDVLRKGNALAFDVVIRIVTELAEAIDHAHSRGIVHRDIKPQNILFDSGHAVLADFGVSSLSDDRDEGMTETGMVVGTPAYMSPEQAGGKGPVDGRADIYAFGCVAFEMLAGEPPFTGASPKAIVARHMQERVPNIAVLRPTVGAEVQRVIERMLAKAPADRYATASEAARDLVAALNGVSGAPHRRRVRATVVTAALLSAAIASALVVWSRRSPPIATRDSDDPRHVAVLYFDDLTPTDMPSHVADGVTEDLIDQLASVRALHVSSPNAVRPFRAGTASIDSIRRALGAGTIVGSSIARSGNTIRATVRLIDGASGKILHTRTFEQPWTELFALQDKLAEQVAFDLRQRLGDVITLRTDRAATKSLEAWNLVQQASDASRRAVELNRRADPQGVELLLVADSLYASAERLDRKWIRPTIKRGRIAIALSVERFASPGPDSADRNASPTGRRMRWLQRAIAYADDALRRVPQSAEALSLRGEALYQIGQFGPPGSDSILPRAEADLRAAVAARPDFADAWSSLAQVYVHDGRFADASIAARNAFDADAFFEVRRVLSMLFSASLNSERFEEAGRACRMGLDHYAGDPRFAECELRLLASTSRDRKDVAKAWGIIERIERDDASGMMQATWSFRRYQLATILAHAGLADSAHAVIARTQAGERGDSKKVRAPMAEAYARAALGENDRAFAVLSEYLGTAPEARLQIAHLPWYQALHSDSRWAALMRPSP